MPDIYVVTMARWGDEENHSYVLGVWSTKAKAEEFGQKEHAYRGGKYEPKIQAVRVDELIHPTDYDEGTRL